MKIRTRFVSNSSSSSFVGYTTPLEHQKALAKLTEKERCQLQKFPFKTITKFGIELIELQSSSSDSYICIQDKELIDDSAEFDDDFWEQKQKLLDIYFKYIEYLEEKLESYSDY